MAKKANADLERVLSQMDKAYASGSRTWFDFLSDDVTVYSSNNAAPFKGKGSYMDHFAKALTSGKRKLDVLSRRIQDMGEISIVYQTVQITQDNVVVNMNQSQVWGMTQKGWKVNHLHASIVGTPQVAKVPSGGNRLNAINVLNEKIASIATAVGVAQ